MRDTADDEHAADVSPRAEPAAADPPSPRDAPPSVPLPAARRTAAPIIATHAPRLTQGPRPAEGQRLTQAPRATQAPRRTQVPRTTSSRTNLPLADASKGTGTADAEGARRRTDAAADHPLSVGGEVRRTLHGASSRQVQRRRLIFVLASAQLVLALAAMPGYITPRLDIAGVAVLGGAAAVGLLALAMGRMFHSPNSAAYVLVGGGILVTIAHLALAGLSGDPRTTAQASLFFLPIILEAGVLFTAEITIGLVGLALTLTTVALFFALTQAKAVPTGEIYLSVIYSMSLQALAGLIAWLVAQFLFESGAEAQRAAQSRLAQAELEALQSLQFKQQQRLRAEIQALQDAITRVLAGTYVARVDVVPGELAELMQSFNLLLERIHSLVETGHGSENSSELIAQMLTIIGEITEGNTSTPRAIPHPAAGPLAAVMQALVQLQTRSANRYAKIEELIGDVAGAVQTGIDGLSNTSEDISSATQIAGKLVAVVDQLSRAVGSSHALVLHARDAVGKLLPPALVQAAAQDVVHRDATGLSPLEAAKLLGRTDDLDGLDIFAALGSDATGEFDILPTTDGDGGSQPNIPPMTIPLPALNLDGDSERRDRAYDTELAAGEGGKHDTLAEQETQLQLLELWRMLDRLAASLGREHRTLRSVLRELGKLSRSVRGADAGLIHGAASLDAARGAIKDLQDNLRPHRAPAYIEQPTRPPRPLSGSGPQPVGRQERSSSGSLRLPRDADVGSHPLPPAPEADVEPLDLRQLVDADALSDLAAHVGGAASLDDDDSPA